MLLEWIEDARAALLRWYDENRRELPWRAPVGGDPDPYAVWVSEVMLQQTRVETVRPYFERWMARFPDLASLAAADLDDVLKAWEGLGYYSRARNLHRAVREVSTTYGGEIPRAIGTLRSLPGVGRYTAGAIASIAFGQQEPLVDGNVRRVFARLLDIAEPTQKELWTAAEALVTGPRPGDLNQSIMELGALVCLPRAPRCDSCPLGDYCRARRRGTVTARPAPRTRKALPTEHVAVALLKWQDRMLVRRGDRGRLCGLWEFPGAPVEASEQAAARVAELAFVVSGAPVLRVQPIFAVEHTFTHVRVTYEAFEVALARCPTDPADSRHTAWRTPEELSHIAMPRAQRRIAEKWLSVLEGERLLDVG